MKGDFSTLPQHDDPHLTRVLKQQGRVELDADANEAAGLQEHLDRTRLNDIIGPCGFPERGGGFRVDPATDGTGDADFIIRPGRGYVDGLLCVAPGANGAPPATYNNQPFYPEPVPLQDTAGQRDLVYLDVWQRHVTTLEDPDLREVALGGLDTTTRLQTVWQVKTHRLDEAAAEEATCANSDAHIPRLPSLQQRGRLSTKLRPVPEAEDPCVIAPGAGYRGLENRLYRVEIHDMGAPLGAEALVELQADEHSSQEAQIVLPAQARRAYRTPWQVGQLVAVRNEDGLRALSRIKAVTRPEAGQSTLELTLTGEVVAPDLRQVHGLEALADVLDGASVHVRRIASFKWSRDNGAVAFAVEAFPVGGNKAEVQRLGRDEVLALGEQDIVEVSEDVTELHGAAGTLARIDEIQDRTLLLSEDVSRHARSNAGDTHPKVRRWDQLAPTADPDQPVLVTEDGAVVIETGTDIELEDGILVSFSQPETGSGWFVTGDYWTFAARAVQRDHEEALDRLNAAPPAGIEHHYCTLALVDWQDDGTFGEEHRRDCRPPFPSLTELEEGCCIDVQPGEEVQAALDYAIEAGGGRVCLCAGVHDVSAPLTLVGARNVVLTGQGEATVLRLRGDAGRPDQDGLLLRDARRVTISNMIVVGRNLRALLNGSGGEAERTTHAVTLHDATFINATASEEQAAPRCVMRLIDTEQIRVERCRLLADSGIVALSREELPPLPSLPEAPAGDGAEERRTIDFEDLDAGTEASVGDQLTSRGMAFQVEPLLTQAGDERSGAVEVVATGEAPSQRHFVRCDEATLSVDFASNVGMATGLTVTVYNQPARSFNLAVNYSSPRVVSTLAVLDGESIGTFPSVDVQVTTSSVPDEDGAPSGTKHVLTFDGPVLNLRIGGTLLFIDEMAFTARIARALPAREPLEMTGRVEGLTLADSIVRYRHHGLWALRAEAWMLDGCTVAPFEGEMDADALFLFQDRTKGAALDALLRHLWEEEAAPAGSASDTTAGAASGTGISALIWRNCVVRDTRLAGTRGVDVGWCVGGAVRECQVETADAGLTAAWLQEAAWTNNAIHAADGNAMAFGASYRARIDDNRVQSLNGLRNLYMRDVLARVGAWEAQTAGFYGVTGEDATGEEHRVRVRWLLLEEMAYVSGLQPLVRVMEDVLRTAYRDTSGFVPYLWAAEPLPLVVARATLERQQRLRVPTVGWFGRAPLPIIALTVEGNTFQSRFEGVGLDHFWNLGGMEIANNEIDAPQGQTLRLEAAPYAAHPAINALLWRMLHVTLKQLIELIAGPELASPLEQPDPIVRAASGNRARLTGVVTDEATNEPLPGTEVTLAGTQTGTTTGLDGSYEIPNIEPGTYVLETTFVGYEPLEVPVTLQAGQEVEQPLTMRESATETPEWLARLPEDLAAALFALGRALRSTFAQWNARVDPVLDAHCRVADNRLRSLVTAVESNLFELVVERNHVTMDPRPLSLEAVLALIDKLDNTALERFRSSVRLGHVSTLDFLIVQQAEEASMPTTPGRPDPVRWTTFEQDFERTARRSRAAQNSGDARERAEALRALYGLVRPLINTYGIWTKGAGCRIKGNHVYAAPGTASDRLPRGGVLLDGDIRTNRALETLHLLILLAVQLAGSGTDEEEQPWQEQLQASYWGLVRTALRKSSDTVVDDNEIIEGAGHGVNVRAGFSSLLATPESGGLPVEASPLAVYNLRVRENQIRSMGGAGINLLSWEADLIGVTVSGNTVHDCGNNELVRRGQLVQLVGGIVVGNMALGRIRGNDILRCGQIGFPERTFAFVKDAAGLWLLNVLEVEIASNQIIDNGPRLTTGQSAPFAASTEGGGVRLQGAFGQVTVSENKVAHNAGVQIKWSNVGATGTEKTLSPALSNYINQGQQGDGNSPCRLSNNALEVSMRIPPQLGQDRPGLFWIEGVDQLSIGSNACRSTAGEDVPLGLVRSASQAIVMGNLFTVLSGQRPMEIKDLAVDAQLVVTNNMSQDEPIRIVGVASNNLHHSHNHPDVDIVP